MHIKNDGIFDFVYMILPSKIIVKLYALVLKMKVSFCLPLALFSSVFYIKAMSSNFSLSSRDLEIATAPS